MGNGFVIDKEFEIPKYSNVCHRCVHLTDGYNKKCKAFPNAIPLDIWKGENKHKRVHPGQNNNIVFKARKRAGAYN